MSDEPLYCTHCGAEEKECVHGWKGDDGKGPFCESNQEHDWIDGRCICCGERATSESLRSDLQCALEGPANEPRVEWPELLKRVRDLVAIAREAKDHIDPL